MVVLRFIAAQLIFSIVIGAGIALYGGIVTSTVDSAGLSAALGLLGLVLMILVYQVLFDFFEERGWVRSIFDVIRERRKLSRGITR